MLKIYGYFRSSAAFRVRIALNLKGLSAELIPVHLRKAEQRAPEYLALNPGGLVPTLIEEDGSPIQQSLAILEYLDETHPQPAFLPKTAKERARVRAIALAIACDIHPINNLRVLNYLKTPLGHDQAIVDEWYRHWIAQGFAGLETMLAHSPATGSFCHGDQPGLADICLVPQVFNATRFNCDMSAYPTCMRIFDHCLTLPAFDAALPSKQPDAEP